MRNSREMIGYITYMEDMATYVFLTSIYIKLTARSKSTLSRPDKFIRRASLLLGYSLVPWFILPLSC